MDTTFVLNHYEHNDSVMVCLNGEAFEEMYGHMMGHGGNMGNGNSGGMMGGMNNGSSEWMNHMNNEHEEGDEHFGLIYQTEPLAIQLKAKMETIIFKVQK